MQLTALTQIQGSKEKKTYHSPNSMKEARALRRITTRKEREESAKKQTSEIQKSDKEEMPRAHICRDISSSSMRLVYGMSENSSKNKCQKSRMNRKNQLYTNVHPIIPHIILENRLQIW